MVLALLPATARLVCSGRGTGLHAGPRRRVRGDGLDPERVVALRNHGQRNRISAAAAVHVLGFKPRAESRVVDIGPALPELGSQSTLDPEMIQLQLDGRHILREVSPDVISSDVQPGETLTDAFCLDYHRHLLFSNLIEDTDQGETPTQLGSGTDG